MTPLQQYFYYVLAPSVTTNDENLDYYYDFSQSILEYTNVFTQLNLQWKWQHVARQNFKEIIAQIATNTNSLKPFVLNLCDGDDTNEAPGVSIIYELEKQGIIYSGANAFFYNITTSKIPMKQAFDAHQIPNSKWKIIHTDVVNNVEGLQVPILIKPAVSGGSMGISVKNVVHSNTELQQRVAEIAKGYRGWNLMVDGLFAEEFIVGEEFTTFIIGNYNSPETCIIYEPIHREFHESLAKEEQFLSFDRLWEIYEEETAMPNNANFYEYQKCASATDIAILKKLTLDVFIACKGVGYARLDFRKSESTSNFYCLEINAQCGLSEDENYTSIGAILRVSNVSFAEVIQHIIEEALRRL
jgi:D-alanine-D-alanine ligase